MRKKFISLGLVVTAPIFALTAVACGSNMHGRGQTSNRGYVVLKSSGITVNRSFLSGVIVDSSLNTNQNKRIIDNFKIILDGREITLFNLTLLNLHNYDDNNYASQDSATLLKIAEYDSKILLIREDLKTLRLYSRQYDALLKEARFNKTYSW